MNGVSLLALIASTAFGLGQSKVASDYLSEPEKYKGKKIHLPCAYVQRASGPPEDLQNVMFGARTTTKGSITSQAQSESPSLLPEQAHSLRNTVSLLTSTKTETTEQSRYPVFLRTTRMAIITSCTSRLCEMLTLENERGHWHFGIYAV